MKLIPEQVAYLREKVKLLKTKNKEYYNYFGDNEFVPNLDKLAKYEQILKTSEYVKDINVNKVDIGTKFEIRFSDSSDIRKYTLVENTIGVNPSEGYISINSPLGESIYGKSEDEKFEYTTIKHNRISKVSGSIVGIDTSKKSYLQYINNVPYENRVCNADNVASKQLESIDAEKCFISSSQKELLMEEAERLANNGNYKERLTTVKKLLEESKVAKLPNNETIGIGTCFSIMTFDKNTGVETKRFELINRAVSDELENEYLEVSSPLGSRVLGLSNNDEVVFRENNSWVSGVVYDIDNGKKHLKTTDPLTYRRCKF